MTLALLYFARVREALGRDGETVDPPTYIRDVAGLIDWLVTRGSLYEEALADRKGLRCAIDQRFASLDSPIAGAREIALFPPVTGG